MHGCRAQRLPSSWLSLALVGLDPGSMAFHRVWWARRQPRAALPPDVPRCLGWKRNPAAGLKGTESSHPALFPGYSRSPHCFEWNSVWVAAGRREKDGSREDLESQRGWRQRPLVGELRVRQNPISGYFGVEPEGTES